MEIPRREEVRIPLFSLYQLMFECSINDLVLIVTSMQTAGDILSFAAEPSDPAAGHWLSKLVIALNGLQKMGQRIELDSSLMQQISKLRNEVGIEGCKIPAMVIEARLQAIMDGIQENLESRKFMYIPRDRSRYWNNPELFGDDFMIGFSTAAVGEMVEAANCYVAGRWTASVFHSMRIAEYGLRRLAINLRVTIKHKGKNCPLEYGDWDTVITAIRNKITDTRKTPRGPSKERALQSYSTAADHCEYMKDIWRNETSHTRRRYSKTESLAVFNRVREFIQPLAKTEATKVVSKKIRADKIKQAMGKTISLRDLMAPQSLQGEKPSNE